MELCENWIFFYAFLCLIVDSSSRNIRYVGDLLFAFFLVRSLFVVACRRCLLLFAGGFLDAVIVLLLLEFACLDAVVLTLEAALNFACQLLARIFLLLLLRDLVSHSVALSFLVHTYFRNRTYGSVSGK